MADDPLQALLSGGALPTTALAPTSRYLGTGIATFQPDGGADPIPYLRRRLCPPAEGLALLYATRVVHGDRRDLLAAHHVGDPALWWRLADANAVLDPRELTDRPGHVLRIGQDGSPPMDIDG